MAKVAFGFKAQDSRKETIRQIEAYTNEKQYDIYKLQNIDGVVTTVYYIDFDGNKIVFSLTAETVKKTRSGSYIPFTKPELKLIDNLNFELDSCFQTTTGQEVYDWFTK